LGAKNQPLNGQAETYFRFLCFYVFMFAYMNPLRTGKKPNSESKVLYKV
jgi:hypothetical protein